MSLIKSLIYNLFKVFNVVLRVICLQIAQQSTKAVQKLWFFYGWMVCSQGLLA